MQLDIDTDPKLLHVGLIKGCPFVNPQDCPFYDKEKGEHRPHDHGEASPPALTKTKRKYSQQMDPHLKATLPRHAMPSRASGTVRSKFDLVCALILLLKAVEGREDAEGCDANDASGSQLPSDSTSCDLPISSSEYVK